MLPTVRPAAAYTIMLCFFAAAVLVITMTIKTSEYVLDRTVISLEG